MFPIDLQNRSTELGYFLDAEAEGNGLVTAACREIIGYLFNVMDLNRIVLRTATTNVRSQAVARRLGFVHEGTHRQSDVLQGKLVDSDVFSLLKQDAPEYATDSSNAPFFICSIGADTDLSIPEIRHAEERFALIDKNRAYLRPWLSWVDKTKSADDMRANEHLRHSAAGPLTSAAIRHRGVFVGAIVFRSVGDKNTRCMEIGYWVGEEHQGKGLITTACRAVIHHAFVDLGMNRIEIHVQPQNLRSRAVPERLGFACEGTLRQKKTNADGEFVDTVVYSLLKSAWEDQIHES